jgi:hypothetical protein
MGVDEFYLHGGVIPLLYCIPFSQGSHICFSYKLLTRVYSTHGAEDAGGRQKKKLKNRKPMSNEIPLFK